MPMAEALSVAGVAIFAMMMRCDDDRTTEAGKRRIRKRKEVDAVGAELVQFKSKPEKEKGN